MTHAKLLMAFLEDCCSRQRPVPFRKFAASCAIGVAIASGGCSSDGSQASDPYADDQSADNEDNLAKADAISHPQGTYANQGATGDLAILAVNYDKTFWAQLSAGGEIIGTYKFTKSTTGSTRYLRMLLKDGVTVVRYAYTLTSTTLKLRKVGSDVTFSMKAVKENCTDGKDNDYDGAVDCGDSDCSSVCGVKYGIPYENECDDNGDNDGDGKVDCADPDCVGAIGCGGTKYGIPYEGDCTDGKDNDGDGKIDCLDSDCSTLPTCQGTKYGIPYESLCDDNQDNDSDGKVDCADPDCANASNCGGIKYGIPYEYDCADDVDNDGDGLIDCGDGDCATSSNCMGTKYGIPYEAECSDQLDNDNDAKIDCDDPDCANAPLCAGMKYAAPQF
jgi:hypothetical protein